MELAAIVFVIVMFLIAYVVFRILKKTVKMAIRALIVFVILAIALVGGAALWHVNASGNSMTPSSKTR